MNTDNGVRALEVIKQASAFMDPEYLVSDSTYVQQQLQGKIAMTNLWASRGGAADVEGETLVVGMVETAMAPLPTGGDKPAAVLWWDGFVIASNITADEAAAAFRVAMQGIDTEIVQANNDAAIRLVEGYVPGRLATGAIATATFDPAPVSYPSTVEMEFMHPALGNQLPAYFTSARDAEATLAPVGEDYRTARKAGVLD